MVECPKGSNQKYDFDADKQRFKLSKILPAGLVFPFDFGMLPGTKGEDGDPLDIIIISEGTGFPGCLIDCRIVGCIQAQQTERNGESMRNDRFLGVSAISNQFAKINDIADLPEDMLAQIEAFFINYNQQAGKQFKVIKRLNAVEAKQLI